MNRRRLLALVGGTSTPVINGCLRKSGRSEATSNLDGWMKRVDSAIQETRTTDLSVIVKNAAGNPVPDASIDTTMQAHEFSFGTAVNASYLIDRTEKGDPYRTHLRDLFNTAALENYHKWGHWEIDTRRAVADSATEWLLQSDIDVRGHNVLWQRTDINALPDDVVTKLESDDPDRTDFLTERTTTHTWDIVKAYTDEITEWDILNEHVHNHAITQAITPDVSPQQSPQVADWFWTAEAAAPETDFYINEYNLITGEYEAHRQKMEELVQYLQKRGAPIDGIGIQGHFNTRSEAITPERLRELFDRFSSLNVDLKITEYDTYGDGWTEANEAEHLNIVLRTAFSHPAVVGFLMWGFWDGSHWQDNAPLFRADWSEKPAYQVYTDLVFGEWWTDKSGTTDENGHYETQVFHGDYEITVTNGNNSQTITPTIIDPDSKEITVRLGE